MKPTSLSPEEETSIQALAGAAEETIELSQSLYRAVTANPPKPSPKPPSGDALEAIRQALKSAPIPIFVEDEK